MMIDPISPDKVLAKQNLMQAIAYFIDRQSLVAQLISDLGLDIAAIGMYGPGAWGWNPAQRSSEVQQARETVTHPELSDFYRVMLRAHELRIPQQSRWHDQQGQEWTYSFHGTGCQIKHVHTQEVIDWNCPSVTAFDRFFFEEHLAWQLTNEHSLDQLGQLQMWIAQNGVRAVQHLIDELIGEGSINPDMTLSNRTSRDPDTTKGEPSDLP